MNFHDAPTLGFHDEQDMIEVNGGGAHPLYKFLREQQPLSQPSSRSAPMGFGEVGAIEWNYTKFLVDRNGRVVNRYKVSCAKALM